MIPHSAFSYYKPSVFAQSPNGAYAPPPPPPPRARGRGATSTGAKRGRKPRGAFPNVGVDPHPLSQQSGPSTSQLTAVQWAQPITQIPGSSDNQARAQGLNAGEQSQGTGAVQSQGSILSLPGAQPITTIQRPGGLGGADEDGDGEDDHELLPAMADDDFAAQSSWNSQSKDNLKCACFSRIVHELSLIRFHFNRVLMDNFSPAQYDRFEAYRRHALPKQAVRKVAKQMAFPSFHT